MNTEQLLAQYNARRIVMDNGDRICRVLGTGMYDYFSSTGWKNHFRFRMFDGKAIPLNGRIDARMKQAIETRLTLH